MHPAPALRMRRAARSESCGWSVTGMSRILAGGKPLLAWAKPSSALEPSPWVSGMSKTASTPAAPSPMITRRTMPILP